MTKNQELAQELKEQFKKGNLKPSQLKKSKSLNDLATKSIQPTETSRRKSLESLSNPNSLKKQLQKAQDQIATLELKLEVQARELTELNNFTAENKHLKEQAKIKQQQRESLRKNLEETNAKLVSVKAELDKSLEARHQGLKNFGKEHAKRVQAEKEVSETVEESAEELVNSDKVISDLRSEVVKLKQTNSQLSRDLSLSQRLVELRRENPFNTDEFNYSLNYFKYACYALLAVWFLVMLRRNNV